ncbi:MAG: hypothetical protein AAFQ43_15020 [Bacteroidota bacterium]
MRLPLPLLALALTGCAATQPDAPSAPEAQFETLAAVDAAARGRVGQIVTLDGETRVGVRFAEIGPDMVRATSAAGGPLAIPTAEVREIVILTRQASDIGPVACGSLIALPFLAGAVEQAISEDDAPTCPFGEDLNAGELLGVAACSGAVAFVVARQTFPSTPRRADTLVPIAPLSRFIDAPRAGVGLWRLTE